MGYFNVKEAAHIKTFTHKHQLSLILIAALFTIVVIMLLVRLPESSENVTVTVTEQNGVYDLTDIADLDGTLICLDPGTAYYPNTYLMPENADTAVPKSINGLEQIRADYLSQRFVLRLPDNSHTYTFTFTLLGRHAMRVYVNGEMAAQTGHPDPAPL